MNVIREQNLDNMMASSSIHELSIQRTKSHQQKQPSSILSDLNEKTGDRGPNHKKNLEENLLLLSMSESQASTKQVENSPSTSKKLKDLSREKGSELAHLRSKLNFSSTPITITKYFLIYLVESLKSFLKYLRYHGLGWMVVLGILAGGLWIIYSSEGPHQETISYLQSISLWYGYWLALGITSSMGFGTGLHTFVLFLGPFIARVTLTAYRCGSLDFDTRGLNSFQCLPVNQNVTVWQISSKIRSECLFWGAGTALGELPPYFVARAAAAAGGDDRDITSIEKLKNKPSNELSFSERAHLGMYSMLTRFGFFGIVLCASIPNPLFDLAGIICGHFSISFWKFFGATFLGKAVIKSTIQAFSVIILFSNDILEKVIMTWLKTRHPSLHDSVQEILDSQSRQFAREDVAGNSSPAAVKVMRTSTFAYVWNLLLLFMAGYFIISIVESLALSQIRQLHEQEISNLLKESQ